MDLLAARRQRWAPLVSIRSSSRPTICRSAPVLRSYLCGVTDIPQDTPHAAAGWYPDQYRTGELRYYDGENWTDHYRKEGALPSIGDWLNGTFAIIREYVVGALVLGVVLSFIGGLVTWFLVRETLGDAAVIDEELVGFDSTRTIVFASITMIVTLLWQGFSGLSLMSFMHRAHQQAEPTIGKAMQRAVSRLPILMVVVVATFLVLVLLFAPVVALIVYGIEEENPIGLLALPIGIGVLLLTIYLWVRFAFLNAAIAAAPKGESIVQASLGISKGRFWGVLGRLLLLTVGLGMAANILGVASGGNAGVINPTSFQQDLIEASAEQNFVMPDVVFADQMPSGGGFIIYLFFSGFVAGLTAIVTASAMMRLYLEANGPTD